MRKRRQSESIRPRLRLARSHDSWRDWWFGYISQPNPAKPGETRYWLLEVLLPAYAPFASAGAAAENLSELFRRSSELVPRFGAQAVAEGLWKVASPLTVSYAHSLWDVDTADELASRALQAMPTLFRDVFAVHCDQAMSSGGCETANELNTTCYMWFDLIGLDQVGSNVISPSRLRSAIHALDEVLAIPHVACQESALHGLGHIAYYDASLVAKTIRRFLGRSGLRDKLRRYAEIAAEGGVQ